MSDVTRPAPQAAAAELIAARFPAARAAFLAGSVLTRRRTPTSDLDVLVLVGAEASRFRESFRHAGWPVELLVQSEQDWHGFAASETAARRSPLLHMTAHGRLLVDADGLGTRLQAEARQRLAAGPPPVPHRQLEAMRYALTDTLDDLRGCADPGERVFLAAHLLERAAELALLADGRWLGAGKWLSRRLAEADPGLHGRLTEGVAAVVTGAADGTERLAAVVTEALERAGGPLWDGYRRSSAVD
ncbi:nucleotidyltransferase domain-containing protein [Streptacidiphilus neutrinimicus]|uniref:nucleotidyltransferase domain-containing protein n=1 Tax=Streptacidiphilus neutrinimicus TaxID=105420 RepID=UPI0005A9A310|nr:nucleotidyltransferase domain-containing protein [Streptacidiphilus neutrinimicus]